MDQPEISGLIGDRLTQARSSRNTPVNALTPTDASDDDSSTAASPIPAPVRRILSLLRAPFRNRD